MAIQGAARLHGVARQFAATPPRGGLFMICGKFVRQLSQCDCVCGYLLPTLCVPAIGR